MTRSVMPVLWVSGAPGTGKSTTGWGLYTAIASQGGSVGYVDIDQLGLVGPPPGGGEESHRIKIDNLVRLLVNLRDAGVRQVVVSGVVDPTFGVEHYLTGRKELAHIDISLVRLTCTRERLRERFVGRGSPPELLKELYDIADELDRLEIGERIDTSDDSPKETTQKLLERCAIVSRVEKCLSPEGARKVSPIPVVVVTGATATGKSTASWVALTSLWGEGVGAALVDVQQLSFIHPAPPPGFVVGQISELACGYEVAGAEVAIVVSRDPGVAVEAAGHQAISLIVLEVSAVELERRVASRAAGHYALLAGDELSGAAPAAQLKIRDRAQREAKALRTKYGTSVAIDSSGQSIDDTAAEILEQIRPLLQPREG